MCRLEESKVPSSAGRTSAEMREVVRTTVDTTTANTTGAVNTENNSTMKNNNKSSGGFKRNKLQIEFGVLFLFGVYGLVQYLNLPVLPSAEFCPPSSTDTHTECRRPDLVAYKVASGMAMIYMGLMGVYNWHFTKELKDFKREKSPEDRLFGYLPAADKQNVASICYQVWDFVISCVITEHREPIFLVHHMLAGMTAYFSLEYQMVPYYSVFYGGCSELSSVFLVFADMDLLFSPNGITNDETREIYEGIILASKALFALTFAYYRVIGWIRYSVPLWSDIIHSLTTGSVEIYRPGKSYFLFYFLLLNVLLGVLQLYWFGMIIQSIIGMLS